MSGVFDAPPAASDAPNRLGQGFLAEFWYVAGPTRGLRRGQTRACRLLDQRILLARASNDRAFALEDRCPHRGVPLSAGRLVACQAGDRIECPYHGWTFGQDGVCLDIPAQVDATALSTIATAAFPVLEKYGLIWIWMGKGPPESSPPALPMVADRPPLAVVEIDFPVHIDHTVLGLIDPAHGPVVHRQWWWRSGAARRAKTKAFAPSELGFTMLPHPPSESGRLYGLFGAPSTEIVFRLPGLRWEHVRLGKRAIVALSALTPLTATTCRMTQIIWTDLPGADVFGAIAGMAARSFLREDQAVLAAQSVGLAEDPPFLWLGDPDQQARWFVQLKREWLSSRGAGRAFVNPVKPRSLTWAS